jgi:hypothetical protein
MTVGRIVHFVAGTLVLLSVLLSQTVHPWFLGLAVFVGANLLQSSMTRWCLMATILRRLGVLDERPGEPAL